MNTWTAIITHWLEHSNFAAGLADSFVKTFAILLVAGAVCLCWRRGAASARHLIWFLALVGVLSLPCLSSLLPAWQKPLWTVSSRANSENELTLTLQWATGKSSVDSLNSVTPQSITAASSVASPAQNARESGFATHFRTAWAVLALTAWLVGLAAFTFSIIIGRLRLRSLRREAHSPANVEWHTLLSELTREFGIGRRVTLLQSADDVMPVTWGWWRPVILLPAEADEWSPERRRVVLLHELAHVKRWDCLTQLIARIACAVYWFNPLVWVAAQRMCVERERACDDLVLNGGCKPSDYAAHLVDIARTFRRVPQTEAIAMARSSQLQGRIAAIVDESRVRQSPRARLVTVCGLAVLAFTATVAAQKSETDSPETVAAKPWYDARLSSFFIEKAAQAHQLTGQDQVPPEVWPYFEAGSKGNWETVTNLYGAMRKRAHQYEASTPDHTLDSVWEPILETELAREQFANWKEKYVLAYGSDIIKSIPPGSIYFGGTDPGRGVITAMTESHVQGKPFYSLTQNALADKTYLDYLRAMYGSMIYIPTKQDSEKAFTDYTAEATQRYHDGKLKPGEDVQVDNGKVQIQGQVAVMNINGLLAKTVFDHNPDREFYIEESFPLDWMYPNLTPNGLIMKINRQTLPELSTDVVQQDHDYWANYLKPIIGDWLTDDTPVADVAAFARKVYLQHDLNGFMGDPQFVDDKWGQKAYSKLRNAIAGLYAWRMQQTKNPAEKARMAKAGDLAFRQAFALCPDSPETIFRYVNLLLMDKRPDDAMIVAETGLKLDPANDQIKALVAQLKKFKSQK
jgi:beta-lactamase regulating signal transducer with metallopeptidase domain